MKMTVVTKGGAIVGAMYGHTPQPSLDEVPQNGEPSFRAGLLAGPGQEIHVLDVSDEVLQIDVAAELHKRLEAEIRKAKKA